MSNAPPGIPTLEEIVQMASECGWDDVGITEASISEEDISAYQKWLSNGYHGNLGYMENQLRCYPQELLPGAKTAILFITYYKQEKVTFKENTGLIASYARGKDYHHLHRKRLKKFIKWLESRTGLTGIAKGFSDSTPILEKALAVKAGLGWFGKNTLLIHRRFGTFTLLSGLLTTLEIPFNTPALTPVRLPRCGTCTRCIDACPTNAISPYELNAARCLSYHLIESKDPLQEEIKKKNPGYAFGCDICQDVCPHNQRKNVSTEKTFKNEEGIGPYLTLDNISSIEKDPSRLFGTPLQRRGLSGLKANLESILNKNK